MHKKATAIAKKGTMVGVYILWQVEQGFLGEDAGDMSGCAGVREV